MLFHPQTSSYILSQLFVTHLGVALLFPLNLENALKGSPRGDVFVDEEQHIRTKTPKLADKKSKKGRLII